MRRAIVQVLAKALGVDCRAFGDDVEKSRKKKKGKLP